ncbi:transglycosylase domain-containing protein [Micromonospora sp. NPDC050686]|uniref:transglycosylase domain-containing protein n=1 Tax=Micromonospora sp. NPDC050686 TaxID=3154631 RepID=UPI0033F56D5F
MSSYGDPSSQRGRAQVPGGDPGNGWSGSAGSGGRASVGARASVGDSASVPAHGAAPGRSGSGRASVPAPTGGSGRATVPVSPAPGGRASVPISPAPGGGRASVPVSPAGGRAAVGVGSAGRASVGAASVGAASVAGRAGVARASAPPPGGPGGPGDFGGPGRRGRGDRDPDAVARAKKRRRINLLIASFAVFIMLAGIGVVGFTYYSTTVVLPKALPMPLSTTVYMSDGKTVAAKLGNQNRQLVKIDQIPQWVQDAVAAAEDRNFYRHDGVDYKGIARAAWNNFTGGDKQGASTITQQYARNAYDSLKDDTYARKVKEAILASKLNDQYTKSEIMEHYLNVIYFGRGAYGIEAAAQTYFGVPAKKLNVAQAAVLAALIKQPVKSTTHKGYDPAVNLPDAQQRWTYVLNNMETEGWLNASGKPVRPTKYPKVLPPDKAGSTSFGVKTPRGNVINYVRKEMEQWGICSNSGAEGKPSCVDELRDGGYRITTTLDPKLQKYAEEAARPAQKGSILNDQPKNLMAALVSIDPSTGRVLAYYGGDSGAGFDYAGLNTDKYGDLTGGHPPGSSFKIYTLAAAINENISVKSYWDATPFKPDGKNEIGNAGRGAGVCGKSCTLEQSTIKSYNVPFYHVAEKIGFDKVVDMARRAGVTTMWNTDGKMYNLLKTKPEEAVRAGFDGWTAFGKYPITVLEHANGVATLAARGQYNKAHFVKTIQRMDRNTGKWQNVRDAGEKLDPQGRLRPDVVDEVTGVLKQIPGPNDAKLENGREAAAKTGTWEWNGTKDNAHAWMIGYTPQVATAVWVGSRDPDKPKIFDKGGARVTGGGSHGLPAKIWKKYMNAALDGKEKAELPKVQGIGDDTLGTGVKPEPKPTGPVCPDPLNPFCPQDPQPQDQQQQQPFPNFPRPGGPGGGGNGGGGGGLLPTTPPRSTPY